MIIKAMKKIKLVTKIKAMMSMILLLVAFHDTRNLNSLAAPFSHH